MQKIQKYGLFPNGIVNVSNSLSKDQKKALKQTYQKRWDDHLAGCNPKFECQNKTWPNG